MKRWLQDHYKTILLIALLFVLVFFPIFSHLDTLPLRMWDEARLAINAWEMNENNNFIVTYFQQLPDMWNTKPPLMIWLQVIFIKLIGASELSIRLPSALAALLTCAVLFVFSVRYLKSYIFGFASVLVLVTSQGYIHYHGTRTGDYDSLLVLFTTIHLLYFYLYIERKNTSYLYLSFVALTLAILTKGIAGLLFTPTLIIFTIIKGQFLALLKTKTLYINILLSGFAIAVYYLLREYMNPGYMQAVWNNELGGRYATPLEGHDHGYWYYFENLWGYRFNYWRILVMAGLITGLLSKNNQLKNLTIYLVIALVSYFLIISQGQTKIEWYDLPMFPLMAMMVAIFITWVCMFASTWPFLNTRTKYFLTTIFAFISFFIYPYSEIIAKICNTHEDTWDKEFYQIGYFLRDAIKGKEQIKNYYLCYDNYAAQNIFYLNILNEKNQNVRLKDWRQLNAGNSVIACQPVVKDYIVQHYKYSIIKQDENIIVYRIMEKI